MRTNIALNTKTFYHFIFFGCEESLWKLDRRYADEHYSIYKFWVGHWPIVSLRHPDDVEVNVLLIGRCK